MSKTAAQSTQKITRNYSGTNKVVDDVFKLTASQLKKWVSPHLENDYSTHEFEHAHIFHTYQSGGKANFDPVKDEPNTFIGRCAPIGGHTHEIKFRISKDDANAIEIISVSGPMEPKLQNIRGQQKIIFVPIDEDLQDQHTHEIVYLKSTEIPKANTNPIAANIAAQEAAKTAPISGIGSAGGRE